MKEARQQTAKHADVRTISFYALLPTLPVTRFPVESSTSLKEFPVEKGRIESDSGNELLAKFLFQNFLLSSSTSKLYPSSSSSFG